MTRKSDPACSDACPPSVARLGSQAHPRHQPQQFRECPNAPHSRDRPIAVFFIKQLIMLWFEKATHRKADGFQALQRMHMKESDWSPLSGLSGSRDCGAAFDPVQRVPISDASRSHHVLTGCELLPKSFRHNLKNVKDPTIAAFSDLIRI